MPAKGRGPTRKRPRKGAADAEADEAVAFLDDDAGGNHQQESEEESEDQETAEQKRVRLARAYLDELRAATLGGDEAGSDEDEAAAAAARGEHELAERLRLDALEASGRLQRKLAHRIVLPQPDAQAPSSRYGAGRFARAHRLSPTALALSGDEATAFTVGKDGVILRWDLETMTRTAVARPGSKAAALAAAAAAGTPADWVKRRPRQAAASSLLLLLLLLLLLPLPLLLLPPPLPLLPLRAQVHVFDAASGQHVRSYPGHKDQVSGLAFREGTHTLYSSSYDRTVKIWSLDDAAYVDTLFGHQAEVFAVAAARAERVVSAGHDHTCRLWKIPEESHLVFRSPSMAQYAVAYLTGSEWVSGGCDGSLQVWNTLKKKPVSVHHCAHAPAAAGAATGAAATSAARAEQQQQQQQQQAPDGPWATAGVDTPAWVQALAVCPGSDLVASGAGDGAIRLWALQPSRHGGAGSLQQVGALPAPGYVNGLALGRSGQLCVAALGQEPRLGRWGRDPRARNGLLLHRWSLGSEPPGA